MPISKETHMHRRTFSPAAITILALGSLGAYSPATAQNYPNKPVKMVVGMAPGGATDVVGRMISQKLSDRLGQPVVVENRGGGGANIGTEIVARAPGDGYTLLLATSTQTVNASLYPKLPYDLTKNFVPVGLVASTPSILLIHPSVPANTVEELIAYAKANPGKLSYASAGGGSATHVASELFKALAGIEMLHVPYKGSGPAMNDLLGGQVQVMFGFNPGQAMQYARAGRVRALAITTEKRMDSFPTLRTMHEAGVSGYEVATWYGVLAPAGTPSSVVAQLNSQIALAVDELGPRLSEIGAYPMLSTPDQFGVFLRKEIAKWADVVKRANIKAE